MGKLNVAIADDNEVMRDLLEEMVTSDDELHLIGMAKDGEEACHLIREKNRMLYYWILLCRNWTVWQSLTGSGQIIH